MDAKKRGRKKVNAATAAENGVAAIAAGTPFAAADGADVLDLESGILSACPSITHSKTRQCTRTDTSSPLQGFLNVDWYETAGCIQWGKQSELVFDEIERYQNQAIECRREVPCSLGDGQIFVHERGMGSGRGSRLQFRLEWCGVTIGLSPRNEATRQLSNFYLKVPGEACLIHGFDRILGVIYAWLRDWGGQLQDEWIRRLDLCLDVPGLDLQQHIFPACDAHQIVSTMQQNSAHGDQIGSRTGFTIGSSGARLTIYDKLQQVLQKTTAVYRQAMIDRRWNGVMPEAAARIEYQLRRAYFQQFVGMRTATDVLGRLPDIIDRLVQTEHRPFFQLTDAVPNRKSRHQDRVGVLPEWAAVVALIREQSEKPRAPLQRLNRGMIDAKKAVSYAMGYLSSAAAQLAKTVDGKADLVELFKELLEINDIGDETIRMRCEDKARKCGTFAEAAEFPFGANQAI
ncbi:MAG TPA: hypothetical protein VGM98_16890 [Schlesneria sp.]|jgi:hypothetical protein